MVELSATQSERRKHSRLRGRDLIAVIRGQRYDVLDISFGGVKVIGRFGVAGALLEFAISPKAGQPALGKEMAEVRGRVERVDGDLTAVRFSIVTDSLSKMIALRLSEPKGDSGGLAFR